MAPNNWNSENFDRTDVFICSRADFERWRKVFGWKEPCITDGTRYPMIRKKENKNPFFKKIRQKGLKDWQK